MALDVEYFAELAACDHPLELAHRRPEALIGPEAQRHAGPPAGLDGGDRIGAIERQRLFAEHGLAGLGRGDDLARMQ